MAAEAGFGEQSSGTGLGEQSSGAATTDLLSRFGISGCRDTALTDGVSGGEVELGLSLGGCFEAEPEKDRVVRVLSISMYDDEGVVQPIGKTCSQPMECKEEHRKRKEVQSLKRLEVKRRRLEKRELRTGAKHDSDRGAVDFDYRLEHGSSSYKEVKTSPFNIPLSISGSSSCKEVKASPFSIPLSLNQASITIPIEDKQSKKMFNIANPIISVEEDKQSKKKFDITDKAEELERSKLEEKPCVSAQGDGPNGRMIQGLLYKYENGVDVRIACMCHGSFLTPTEFLKHAGGGDVAHPLRHIVVSRPPFAF